MVEEKMMFSKSNLYLEQVTMETYSSKSIWAQIALEWFKGGGGDKVGLIGKPKSRKSFESWSKYGQNIYEILNELIKEKEKKNKSQIILLPNK